MKELSGKVAFITGGASGIGLAIATSLGRHGVRVMLADIDGEGLARAIAELQQQGVEADGVACDVSDRKQVRTAAQKTIARFGKVHIVCNNAGVGFGGLIGDVRERDWDWIIDVNIKGVIHGVETFVPLIEQHGEGGHIVNSASMGGFYVIHGNETYAMTKFAVVAMSEGWAAQLAPEIGLSILCPDWVQTRLAECMRVRPARYGGPMKLTPEEVAKTPLGHFVASGIPAAVVGERVVEAILDNELYVFTSDENRDTIIKRHQAALAAFDRVATSPALRGRRG